MSNQIQPFDFNGIQVRVLTDEHGNPWFLGADVCAILGTATNHIREYLDADEITNIRSTDAVETSKTSILVGDLAKVLKGNGVDIGGTRLFAWLRDNGWLMKTGSSRNMPTQKSMELGLFEIKETTVVHSDGHTTINKTPKVTGKGQTFFVNKFLGHREITQ